MNLDFRKFAINFADGSVEPQELTDDTIMIGRLDTCAVRLDHPAVSRIHASINFSDSNFTLANLSTSNILTVNGRLLGPKKSDVLADGDIIQIGPFTINVERVKDALLLVVNRAAADKVPEAGLTKERPALDAAVGGVLDVFWEKRSRDKEDWGTRLRPTEKPIPGKAMFNWKPTGDLRRPWRTGLFVWAFILVGGIAAFAYFRYPQVYAPEALASPHASKIDGSPIAARSNGNSCTTCHNAREPLENACIKCHTAEQFHASNTKAHQEAGITCTVCHQEHKGSDHSLMTSAIQSCAACHDNGNTKTFNGKSVRTAHGGSYGYPVVDGVWKWKGVYREVAEMIPEINSPATGDKDEQAKLSRHFHSVHVARLIAPSGVAADKFGLVSCSSCHKSFTPIDRTTPRQTCAACHTTREGETNRDQRFALGQTNCISCHVQHAYSGKRWSEFLSEESLKRRNDAVAAQIKRLEEK
ncbi:MAG: FHA domain-containing protein [Chloracidobacterium sp.]|nr:FHA domain-containing protein [Chloracidobacterium sp.]